MRKVDRYYFKEKEKVLVLRREKSEPSENSTSPLTSQDKVKAGGGRDQSSKQGTNRPSLCSCQCSEGAILVPQEFSEETKQHLPLPPSALVVHMSLEHKRRCGCEQGMVCVKI